MYIDNGKIKEQLHEWIKLGYVKPEDLPHIELYMDQVTTFMDKHLSKNKRTGEDKTLTKTMINNYTKNNLLPPSTKKRYSKEHIILLIYIYYLKNVVSINDISVMLEPLIEGYFDSDEDCSLDYIYSNMFELVKKQYDVVEQGIMNAYELAENEFSDSGDDYLKKLTFLSLLAYDIFTKKKLMEHIIDDMKKDEKNS